MNVGQVEVEQGAKVKPRRRPQTEFGGVGLKTRRNGLGRGILLRKCARHLGNCLVVLVLALAACITACGPSGVDTEITETRTVTTPPALPGRQATSAERFGFGLATPPSGPGSQSEVSASGQGGFSPDRLAWQAPSTWTRLPDRLMRLVTHTMGASGRAECYATVLPGTGGGAEANINRWRRQMGQPPLSHEEIQGLPQITVLGRPTPMVEISGDFTGMKGDTQPGFMMLAALCTLPGHSLFIKMTGPEAEVRAEKDNFTAFCESFEQ